MSTPDLIQRALEHDALRLGSFTLKSGRPSPYFFNLAQMSSGDALAALATAYADALEPIEFDVLFGPAYKGIPLAAVVAVELSRRGRNVGWAYNRKEAKTHGEGGTLVGAPVSGRIAIVDDVLTAGTAIRQVIDLVRAAGGTPAAAVIALDRQETDDSGRTALAALGEDAGLQVASLFTAADIQAAIHASHPDAAQAISDHLDQYGPRKRLSASGAYLPAG